MNPFEYIRERITEIADTLAAVDGRDPSWDYADITQLLDNIEKDYNAKYGSSDVVYRQDAIDAIRASTSKYTGFMEMEMYTDDDAVEAIKALPPAQPYTEDEIQKMQDLEQAQLDKAFELGKQTAQSEPQWIPCHDPSDLPKDKRIWITRYYEVYGFRDVSNVIWDMTEWSDNVSGVVAYMPYIEPEPYKEGGKNEK